MSCQHPSPITTGEPRCYSGPVATGPDQNRAAHGNICIQQRCPDCGRERAVNVNQRHCEYGPWFLPRNGE